MFNGPKGREVENELSLLYMLNSESLISNWHILHVLLEGFYTCTPKFQNVVFKGLNYFKIKLIINGCYIM